MAIQSGTTNASFEKVEVGQRFPSNCRIVYATLRFLRSNMRYCLSMQYTYLGGA